jgi:hypothetical protein
MIHQTPVISAPIPKNTYGTWRSASQVRSGSGSFPRTDGGRQPSIARSTCET